MRIVMMTSAEILMTPERTYRIQKVKNKTWDVRYYDAEMSEDRIVKDDGTVLGIYPSKIVAFGAVAIDVDNYTRKDE